jgi:hypothetical protein
MASIQESRLAVCDNYRVLSAEGLVGRVEETWFGALEEPVGVAVRLEDGRRGLLLAEDVAGVWPESRSVTVVPGSRLLRLEPPHVEPDADGSLSASWRASGGELELPQPARGIRDAVLPRRPVVRPLAARRPLWQTIGLVYLVLTLIVGALIGLDILVAYLVTGAPPY